MHRSLQRMVRSMWTESGTFRAIVFSSRAAVRSRMAGGSRFGRDPALAARDLLAGQGRRLEDFLAHDVRWLVRPPVAWRAGLRAAGICVCHVPSGAMALACWSRT